eukprot:gnl/MRDRNA2_/MRDRNA2_197911_c0_seq1.p1 gnl/MRDRNA2_/MRDRNA2_197911_c0~~gnl/MRDRNA2_/MRDRNA2_197911_c0_seq1.p1  ORF type:complete len:110 (-),score=12.23 gnl/MRDRNA2_/MRDRNA2_197911_c0_seq1:8-337(-)
MSPQIVSGASSSKSIGWFLKISHAPLFKFLMVFKPKVTSCSFGCALRTLQSMSRISFRSSSSTVRLFFVAGVSAAPGGVVGAAGRISSNATVPHFSLRRCEAPQQDGQA